MSLLTLILLGLLAWLGLAILVSWGVGRAAQLGEAPAEDSPTQDPNRQTAGSAQRGSAKTSGLTEDAPPDRRSSA